MTAKSLVAFDEQVSAFERAGIILGAANGERFEKRPIGEEDAGVLRSKRMTRIGRDREAEPREPVPRTCEIGERQDEMIEDAGHGLARHTNLDRFTAASMKLVNKGWGSNGLDFSSG